MLLGFDYGVSWHLLKAGMMGSVADAALAHNGEVIGVIPRTAVS